MTRSCAWPLQKKRKEEHDKKNINNNNFNKDWRDENDKEKDQKMEEYLINVFPRMCVPPFFTKHHRFYVLISMKKFTNPFTTKQC